MTVQRVSPGYHIGQAARSGRQPGELSTLLLCRLEYPPRGQRHAARLIRVVLLTLATVGGGSGSTQAAPPKRIGLLVSEICPGPGAVSPVPFVRRLAELGWIEGQR